MLCSNNKYSTYSQRIKGELCLKVFTVDALGYGVKSMSSHGSFGNLLEGWVRGSYIACNIVLIDFLS